MCCKITRFYYGWKIAAIYRFVKEFTNIVWTYVSIVFWNFHRNIGTLYGFAWIKFLNSFKNLINTDKCKLKVSYCLLHFSVAFKSGFAIHFSNRFISLHSFQMFYSVWKNNNNSAIISMSCTMIFSSSTNLIFFIGSKFVESSGLTVFHDFLLSTASFRFEFVIIFFSFSQRSYSKVALRDIINFFYFTSTFRNRFCTRFFSCMPEWEMYSWQAYCYLY